ncbi:MAG TPA: hypothetical protein VG520_09440 [Candidatus Dormibacteraeota bacterium]|nr:hypothetical protein [Candidatus Dormibacteraeota bacterium]
MDERRRIAIASELGLSVEELREAEAELTPGLAEALMGGLIRFEDALLELSR